MGTTPTAILFAGVSACAVGDSCAYLYRDGQLTQITRDDTFVQTLVDEGQITAEQAHAPATIADVRALTGQPVEPTSPSVRPGPATCDVVTCCAATVWSDVVTSETLVLTT